MNNNNFVSPARLGVALLGATLWTSNAGAVPIDTDLSISGSVLLDGIFSDGNTTQDGEIRLTSGGAATNAAFSTTPGTVDGADDGTTIGPATNPLTNTLTDTGDGIGWSTDVDAAFQAGFDFNNSDPGYDYFVSFLVELLNNSATDTFTVTVRVDFDQTVDADGGDSFAITELDLEVDNVNERLSDLESDTILGDRRNGADLGTFGAPVSESDNFTFDIMLAPGATAQIDGTHQWFGAVYQNPGMSLTDLTVDITIDDVACSGPNCSTAPPPTPMPLPGTLALLGIGVSGLLLGWRRRASRGV